MEDNLQVPYWDNESAEKGGLYPSKRRAGDWKMWSVRQENRPGFSNPQLPWSSKVLVGKAARKKRQDYTKGPDKTADKLIHRDVCCRTHESQEHVKDPDIKGHILCGSIYMKV